MGILMEQQAEAGAREPCRKRGIRDGTFRKWRSKHGDGVSGAWRRKALGTGKMLAEHMPHAAALKEVPGLAGGERQLFERSCRPFRSPVQGDALWTGP